MFLLVSISKQKVSIEYIDKILQSFFSSENCISEKGQTLCLKKKFWNESH